jgi:hypothetical protein
LNKINLLIISVYYPPINSIASYRIEAFAKYLDKEKFNIDIVSLNTIESPHFEEKNNLRIFRLSNNSLFKTFTFNVKSNWILHKFKVLWNLLIELSFGKYYGWKIQAIQKVLQLQQERNYHIMLSSFAPIESHLVALFLKKKFPNIKWIADMRDEISENPLLPRVLRIKYRRYEKEIIKYCDVITAASQPFLENFKKKAFDLNRQNNIIFEEIRNGFDFNMDIDTLNSYYPNKKFTISYVGSLYGRISPQNFFKALISLEDDILNNIKVNFVGTTKPIKIPLKLQNVVNIIPKVPHNEAIKIMKNSDALLLIHPEKTFYPGKLFEYLGSLRPIIALVNKEGISADLIRRANAGFIADFNNIEEIRNAIKKSYYNWKRNIMPNFNFEFIKTLHRKYQVKKLENLILKVI